MLGQLKDYINSSATEAINSPVLWYGSLGLIILVFLWWLFRRFRTELVPVFKDDEGSVTITPQALRELVRKSCLYIDGIHSPSTYINLQRSKLRLKVKIRLAEGVNVKNTRRLLKQNIETVMLENLNFSNFSGIDIIIRGFHESKNIKEND